ncbi:conserved protein of unknown function [Xenorhabdus poinarii G6]|uniref:Uncharacterized protein n=1 Tax=Xenorhabdus poinarii G6 TaxID=1354304 RepID=A0A068R891_9GAMM|nr:conserved protein of unknown function [Xenorhabdus poinarii G6]
MVYLNDFYTKKNKKHAHENKIQKNDCQRRKSPYNAPPLTDATLIQAAPGREKKAKINA